MAEASWPSPTYNSHAVNDVEYEQLTEPAGGDGVIGSPSDSSVVYADDSGMTVRIRAGKGALVRGHRWTSGTTDFTRTITANASGLPRIDLVVLRLDRSTWNVTSVVKAGTPGAGAPSVTQDTGTTGVFEIPLATVTVPSGDTAIGASQVTRVEYYLAEPPLVCTSGTRPGHAAGRRIYETNTSRTYISNGSSWVAVTSGAFACTSGTRPPHQVGLLIYETDTARLLVSTGTAWLIATDDSGVVSVSPANSFTLPVNRLIRRNGIAVLALSAMRATAVASGTRIQVATIQEGFRPLFTITCATFYGSSNGLAHAFEATPSGAVYLITSAGTGLNGNRDTVGSLTWPVA